MSLKPLSTEKAVMKIETENVLTFEVGIKKTKPEIKKEVENLFNVKVKKIRIKVIGNKKYAYVKLNPDNLAIDVATKLGLM